MVKSKAWNWATVTEDFWDTPSEDVYYYVSRWKQQGYHQFLDLGCGRGRHALFFAQHGFDTAGFDLSHEGLQVLREKARNAELAINIQWGDIHQLPYEASAFDCVLAYHVISHTDTAGIRRIIHELKRVLRCGGEFFVTVCSQHSPSFRQKGYPHIDENTILKTEEPERDIPHFYTTFAGITTLFHDFDIIRIRHIEDIFGESRSWHYFIHGKKRENRE